MRSIFFALFSNSLCFQTKENQSIEIIQEGALFVHNSDLEHTVDTYCDPILLKIGNVNHKDQTCQYTSNYSDDVNTIDFSELLSQYTCQSPK